MGLQLLEFIKMYIIYRDARRDPIETRSPRSLSLIDGVESYIFVITRIFNIRISLRSIQGVLFRPFKRVEKKMNM